MGVSSTINRVTLAGDGISVSFPFPYYFFRKSDILVYVYDTLLGGITGPYVLNTDYTITGAVNYQGLYQNGGNVVFSTYVPLVTDIVVIIRSPIQQQNYALLQGGTISSAAIVEQFDYLTLLVQRLEDQVSRCIQVPDGLGEPFNGALPSTVSLNPGASPVVNPAGNGWILGPGGGGGGGSGTVTSVAVTMPGSVFTVVGSPISTFGTIAVSLINQGANLVFAGPAAGPAAAPTFRALVPADLPASGPLNVINGGNVNYNFSPTDAYVRSGTALTAPRIWTLQPAVTVGQEVVVKNLKSQGFNITLAGNGGDTIDGSASVTLIPGISLTLICGAVGQWDIV